MCVIVTTLLGPGCKLMPLVLFTYYFCTRTFYYCPGKNGHLYLSSPKEFPAAKPLLSPDFAKSPKPAKFFPNPTPLKADTELVESKRYNKISVRMI